jgi:ferredoxin-like protein FixX
MTKKTMYRIAVLTTVECNLPYTCPFAQIEQRRSVHIEAVRRQVQAALDSATLVICPAHIYEQQITGA